MTLQENLETVREAMARACQRCGRSIDGVTLIAVTKFVETARIAEAVAAGVTEIGENRAQEFTEKLTFYKQNHLRAHFIGQLQTNKVKYICGKADLIQSVDREDLDRLIDRIAAQRHVCLRGLMCVPPATGKEEVRPYFRAMRQKYEALQSAYPALPIDTLSMGMSHDFDVAIEEGATTVRVGTAIFGPRIITGGQQNG